MPEYSNYLESLDPVVGALSGDEIIGASKDGDAVSLTAQQIADLGGGGGTWGTITGTLSDQTDLYNYLRATRTVTGADASDQTDDNSLIIFNSATPFNFTLDQLTADSKISFINYGAGVVTFVAGAGVTITGDTTLSAAADPSFPSALVIYDTSTTPRIITGSAAGSSAWGSITGTLSSQTDLQTALDAKQALVNSAVVLTDAATIDITAIKHTLATSAATRTFTISYTGDESTIEVTLSATSATYTFPATALCVSEGVASGNNTCGLAGVSGDIYMIVIKKIGSNYRVVCKNFGQ